MRKFSLLLILGLLVTTGLGCKGPTQEQQAASRPVTLNYWTVFDNVSELQRLAALYKQTRPYVTINIRQLRYEEYQEKFLTALADDVGPDIISIHVRDLQKHASRLSTIPASVSVANIQTTGGLDPKTTVSLEQNLMPTLTTIRNNYLKTVGDDVVFGEKIYGLPLTVDTMALYYNKDLLDTAGIATPPTTWEEFLETVKATTKTDPTDQNILLQSGVALGTGKNIDNAPDIYALLLAQKGVKIIENGSVRFAQNEGRNISPALESLRFYTDFARSDKEAYTWNESQNNAFDEFVRGKSVFYFGFGFDYDRIKSRAPQMNLALTPMLQLSPEAATNIASYWVQTVPKKSKRQNEAWDFVRFLSTPENIKAYSTKTRVPSALRIHNKEQRNEENPLSPFAVQVLQAENWYRGNDYAAGQNAFRELITGYLKPYNIEVQDQEERDSKLIITAAQTLQQTL